MAIRGLLAYDDAGQLVQIDPNTSTPNDPPESDIEPVTMRDLVVTGVVDDNLDLNGNDIADIGGIAITGQVSENVNFGENDIENAGAVSVDSLNITNSLSSGDYLSLGINYSRPGRNVVLSTSNSSYQSDTNYGLFQVLWDDFVPSGATGSVRFSMETSGPTTNADVRLQNGSDSEEIIVKSGISGGDNISDIAEYTPQTTDSRISVLPEVRSNDGNSITLRSYTVDFGIQLP